MEFSFYYRSFSDLINIYIYIGLLFCILASEAHLFSAQFRAFEFPLFIISISLILCLINYKTVPGTFSDAETDHDSKGRRAVIRYLKKNQNTPRPSEHPPAMVQSWGLCTALCQNLHKQKTKQKNSVFESHSDCFASFVVNASFAVGKNTQ